MRIVPRSRLYIDCPYCRKVPKGRIGSLYEWGEEDKNYIFIKFERCPVCQRLTEARLGLVRELQDGNSRYSSEVQAGKRKRGRPSKRIQTSGDISKRQRTRKS